MVEQQIKVVIADDHPQIRKDDRKFLEMAPEIRVVGEAGNGKEAVDLVKTQSPDVLILDLEMPILDGAKVVDLLPRLGYKIPILILSACDSPCYAAALIDCGACGYILKDEAPVFLVGAVRRAFQGEVVGVSPGVAKKAAPPQYQ